jgi:sortase A
MEARPPRLLAVTVLVVALTACATDEAAPDGRPTGPRGPTDPLPTERARPVEPAVELEEAPGPRPSDGRPRRALLSIPAIGVDRLPVVPYRGRTDDGPGTRIQDGGVAASPYGPEGGTGPGGIGNYQVTAHRTSSTRAFAGLPRLRIGDRAVVEVGRTDYHYVIRASRRTSFRSARSLAEQRAPVPGRPGAVPRRAFLTLSTCATAEDHAAGNYWSDEFSNPEHRFDRIGVLTRVTRSSEPTGAAG